jgi:hypothetical protein
MCKINGHSLFTYLVQPHNAKKLYSSHERAKREAAAKQQAEETKLANSDGDENAKTATTAQVNKQKKNQSLNSLRVPLESSNVGASVGSSGTPLGLNLGG